MKYHYIEITNKEAEEEFMILLRKKLGKGVNAWGTNETIEDLIDTLKEGGRG